MQVNESICESVQVHANASQCSSSQVHARQCKSKQINTWPCELVQVYASQCSSSQVYVSQCKSMQVNTWPWESVQVHASQISASPCKSPQVHPSNSVHGKSTGVSTSLHKSTQVRASLCQTKRKLETCIDWRLLLASALRISKNSIK